MPSSQVVSIIKETSQEDIKSIHSEYLFGGINSTISESLNSLERLFKLSL